MQENAEYFWVGMNGYGFTKNAVCGMLGNIQTESTVNPGIWQGLHEGNLSGGFGLVQWTPATKYIDWANANGFAIGDMDGQMSRIQWELENNVQYRPTNAYPLTFTEFKYSELSPAYLARAFCINYEQAGDPNLVQRGNQAEYWWEYLGEIPFVEKSKGKPIYWTHRKHKINLMR